ncbi:MAG: phosphate ABC transporter permease PstA, partial [candidate division WOR-3 bacterium]
LTNLIEINIANLAGVPSIIYGLLGLEIFVRFFKLGRSILAGSLTLSLLVLPIVIMATRESIRLVPSSIREASLALGATKWQTIKNQVLPLAMPGILTGIILAVSRAIGETAPLITIGALTYIAFLPTTPLSPFTVLPIQIFNWVSRPQKAFHHNAAGAIIVLLFLTFMLNLTSIILRNYYRKKYKL